MAMPRITIVRCLTAIAVMVAIVTAGRFAWGWRRFDKSAGPPSIQVRVDFAAPAPLPYTKANATMDSGIPEIEEAKRLWRFSLGEDRGFRIKKGLVTADEVRLAAEELRLAKEEMKQEEVSADR
jgi:hypothetical protein